MKKSKKKMDLHYEYADGESKIEIEKHRNQLAEKEYERQISDYALVENKASFAMVLFVAIVPLIVSAFESLKQSAHFRLSLGFSIAASALSVICFALFVMIIFSRKVHKIEVDAFCVKKYNNEAYYLAEVTQTYRDTVKKNAKPYREKHLFYKIACVLIFADFLLALLAVIFTFIV